MMRKIIAVFVAIVLVTQGFSQEFGLTRGMVIKKTTRIKKGTYTIDGFENRGKSVIVIEGNNIVVDFNMAILKGSAGKTRPDQYFGTAIIVRKGKNITIRNLIAKNYMVAVSATGIEGLKIDNCNFSYNFRNNVNTDKDEWNSDAAAIKLRNCNNAIITNCKVAGGNDALGIYECNYCQVYNNDFSFNSGVGINLTRCSNNRVMYNRVNFNIGLEYSTGILVFTHSDSNSFYKNSVTHCGNGLQLYGVNAESGIYLQSEGNRIMGNDFSYSPGNGIKTSSVSSFIYDNRLYACSTAIKAMTLYNSTISNNKFRNNITAIDIEKGAKIVIEGNIFLEDGEAISIAGSMRDSGNKMQGVFNKGYLVYLNSFNKNPLVFNLSSTDSFNVFNNRYSFVDEVFRIDSSVTNIDSLPVEEVDTAIGFPFVKDPANPFKGSAKFAGRDKIMLTEWGPYDFQYPFIWHTNPSDSSGDMKFELFGPAGKWKVVSKKGIDIAEIRTDSLPSGFKGTPVPGSDIEIILEYKGAAFTDQFGNRIPANKPYRFSFRKMKATATKEQVLKGPFFQKY